MNLEAGKYYKTRNGKKAYLSAVIGTDPFTNKDSYDYPLSGFIDNHGAASWKRSGLFIAGDDSCYDLIAEWREPVKVNAWVLVHSDKSLSVFPTRDDAVKCDNTYCAASSVLVYVTGTEGVE